METKCLTEYPAEIQAVTIFMKINASWVSKYSYISIRNKKSTTLNISETNKITSKNPYLVYKCLEFVWIPGSVYNRSTGVYESNFPQNYPTGLNRSLTPKLFY